MLCPRCSQLLHTVRTLQHHPHGGSNGATNKSQRAILAVDRTSILIHRGSGLRRRSNSSVRRVRHGAIPSRTNLAVQGARRCNYHSSRRRLCRFRTPGPTRRGGGYGALSIRSPASEVAWRICCGSAIGGTSGYCGLGWGAAAAAVEKFAEFARAGDVPGQAGAGCG